MSSLLKFKKVKELSLYSKEDETVILHVSTADSWRGGEQQLYYLMEELEHQKVNQYLLCLEGSEMHQKAKQANWNVSPVKAGVLFSFRLARAIKHACNYLDITCVHTHDSKAHTSAFTAALLGNDVPFVVSRRVDFPIGKSPLTKAKYNHKNLKNILCVSDAIKDIMAARIEDQSKLRTVHSGIDFERFRSLEANDYLRTKFAIPEGDFLVGNTSAIADHKDYFTFIDTAEDLINQDFPASFFIIGSGPMEREIKEYAASKNLKGKLHFTGFINEILPVLKSLDLFLITSKTEGLGTSILDAFACEVPVVATRAGGIPEIVHDQKTGLLADVGDSKYLAELVQRVLEDKVLTKDLTMSAMELLAEFDKRRTAEKTLEIYKG